MGEGEICVFCGYKKAEAELYGMEEVYDATGNKLKGVKLTEREHKILVVTEWHEFSKDRAVFDEALRQVAALKGKNKSDIDESEERLNVMKYGEKKAPQKDIDVEKRKWERLHEERESLLKREGEIGRESMQLYNNLDAFLELARNGFLWWSKVSPSKNGKWLTSLSRTRLSKAMKWPL